MNENRDDDTVIDAEIVGDPGDSGQWSPVPVEQPPVHVVDARPIHYQPPVAPPHGVAPYTPPVHHVSARPIPGQTLPPVPSTTKPSARRWLIGGGIVLALALIIGLVVGLSGSGDGGGAGKNIAPVTAGAEVTLSVTGSGTARVLYSVSQDGDAERDWSEEGEVTLPWSVDLGEVPGGTTVTVSANWNDDDAVSCAITSGGVAVSTAGPQAQSVCTWRVAG